MPKLRLRADAPPGRYTVGPLDGDWQPGDERDLADCHALDIDAGGMVPLSVAFAERIVAASDGLVELVPDPAPPKRPTTAAAAPAAAPTEE